MKKIVFALLLIAVFGGIQVVSANGEAPVAVDDRYGRCWDMAEPMINSDIGVLQNDYDPNGLPLTAELVSGPTHGGMNFLPDGGFWYHPHPHFLGEDTFTYRAYNGYEYSEPACVTIIISRNQGAPDTREDAYTISADTTLDVPAPGILGNDWYPYEDICAFLIQGPEHGYLSLNIDGSFTYIPDAGFVGTDGFLYVAEYIHFSDYTPVTITVHKPGTPVPEFPGMFVVIGGIILGTAFIATRIRIHR
ncbi:Ig-like domain-containing protein [Methanogenium cariaci]|jgi:Big-like domain-containing protein